MDYKIIGLKALGATAIGVVVTGGYYYMTLDSKIPEETPIRQFSRIPTITVKDLLTGKKILSIEDDKDNDDWKKLLGKHLSTEIDEKQKLPISGVEIKSGDENDVSNIEIIKNTCKILLTKTENHANNVAIAENWCTKESQFLKSTEPVTKARP